MNGPWVTLGVVFMDGVVGRQRVEPPTIVDVSETKFMGQIGHRPHRRAGPLGPERPVLDDIEGSVGAEGRGLPRHRRFGNQRRPGEMEQMASQH